MHSARGAEPRRFRDQWRFSFWWQPTEFAGSRPVGGLSLWKDPPFSNCFRKRLELELRVSGRRFELPYSSTMRLLGGSVKGVPSLTLRVILRLNAGILFRR